MNNEFYETVARFYDAENAEMVDDLILYGELADEVGGPVLDIGCGTGRVMLHLAQQGFRTVGLDRSREMLVRGQRKLEIMPELKPLVSFVFGDALEATLPGQFNLIIVPYNTFMQFTEQVDQIAALHRFCELLNDSGLLVMDLPNAGEIFGSQDTGAVMLERTFVEPDSGHTVMQHSVSMIDRAAQQLHITWIYDEIAADGLVRRTVAPLLLRCVLPGEMDLMLASAGLRRVQTYGDYMREPFVDGSPRMIVLAQKAQGERAE